MFLIGFLLSLIICILFILFFFCIFIIIGKNQSMKSFINQFDVVTKILELSDYSIIQLFEFLSFYIFLYVIFLLWFLISVLVCIKTEPKNDTDSVYIIKKIMNFLIIYIKIIFKYISIHILVYNFKATSNMLKQDVGLIVVGLITIYLGTYMYEYFFLNDIDLYIKTYDESYRLYCLTHNIEYDSFRQQTMYSYWRMSYKAQTYAVFTVRSLVVGLGSYMIFTFVKTHFDGGPKDPGVDAPFDEASKDPGVDLSGFGSAATKFVFNENTTNDDHVVLVQQHIDIKTVVDQTVKSISKGSYNLFKLSTLDVQNCATHLSLLHTYTWRQVNTQKDIQKAVLNIDEFFRDFFSFLEKVEYVVKLRKEMYYLKKLGENANSLNSKKNFLGTKPRYDELNQVYPKVKMEMDEMTFKLKDRIGKLMEKKSLQEAFISPKEIFRLKLDNIVKILNESNKKLILERLEWCNYQLDKSIAEAKEDVVITFLNRARFNLAANNHIDLKKDSAEIIVKKMDFPFLAKHLNEVDVPCDPDYLYGIFNSDNMANRFEDLTSENSKKYENLEFDTYVKFLRLVDKQEDLNIIKTKIVDPVGLVEEEYLSFDEFFKLVEVISDTFC